MGDRGKALAERERVRIADPRMLAARERTGTLLDRRQKHGTTIEHMREIGDRAVFDAPDERREFAPAHEAG